MKLHSIRGAAVVSPAAMASLAKLIASSRRWRRGPRVQFCTRTGDDVRSHQGAATVVPIALADLLSSQDHVERANTLVLALDDAALAFGDRAVDLFDQRLLVSVFSGMVVIRMWLRPW